MTPEIEGRRIDLPVEVREAQHRLATYFVPAAAAQRLIEPSGLEVAQPRPGRAMLGLAFVRYEDTDLGAYNEFALSILVRPHDAGPATAAERSKEVRRQRIGVYLHRLPVDDGFSLAAGRAIWGYPKTMASFDRRREGRSTVWTLSRDGVRELSMGFRDGFVPWMQKSTPPTYTLLDGVLRLTRWETRPRGIRSRPGGVGMTLGVGEIAEDLRSLGLPKRPLFSASVAHWRARFSAAEVVTPAPAGVSSEKESG